MTASNRTIKINYILLIVSSLLSMVISALYIVNYALNDNKDGVYVTFFAIAILVMIFGVATLIFASISYAHKHGMKKRLTQPQPSQPMQSQPEPDYQPMDQRAPISQSEMFDRAILEKMAEYEGVL